jgi:hypothetical protein
MQGAAPSSTSQRIRRLQAISALAVATGQTVQDRGFGELKVGEAQMVFGGLALMCGTRLLFHALWPPCHKAIILSPLSSYFWLGGDTLTTPQKSPVPNDERSSRRSRLPCCGQVL